MIKIDANDVKWKRFEKYKTSDGEFDFTNATTEDILTAYGLLEPNDEIRVVKKDDKEENNED